MLISVKLDINNIIWETELNKKTKRADFIIKLIHENTIRGKR